MIIDVQAYLKTLVKSQIAQFLVKVLYHWFALFSQRYFKPHIFKEGKKILQT
jgi:hypothetical protein